MTTLFWLIGAYLFGFGAYHVGKSDGYGKALDDQFKREEELKIR